MTTVRLIRRWAGLGLLFLLAAKAGGADWPTYLHDPARSGVTDEGLSLPLTLEWTFEPAAPPAAGWGPAEQDVADCVVHPLGDRCGGEVCLMCKDNVLVLCGSPYHADHELEAFNRGEFARRSLTAFDAATGRRLWSRPANYQTRPIIVGRTIFAEPWAFDLATGAPKTGSAANPWKLFRGSGCGGFSASAGALFFRKGSLSYFDLEGTGAIQSLVSGQRPSCWVSFVPAGGLVLAPEGSAGCTCPYPIQGSAALYPRNAPVDTFH
jgi:hypothetical protein